MSTTTTKRDSINESQTKTHLGVKVSPTIHNLIQKEVDELGTNRTDVITEIITKHYESDDEQGLKNRLDSAELQKQEILLRYKQLSKKLNKSVSRNKSIKVKLSLVEHRNYKHLVNDLDFTMTDFIRVICNDTKLQDAISFYIKKASAESLTDKNQKQPKKPALTLLGK